MKIAYLWATGSSRVMGNTAEAVHVQSICRAFKNLGHQVFIVSGELEVSDDSQCAQCPVPVVVIPSPNSFTVTSRLHQWINRHSASQPAREFVPNQVSASASDNVPVWRPRLVWNDLLQRTSAWRYQRYFYLRARKAMEQERPDALYQRYTRYGLAGIWLAQNLGIPLILEMNASLTQRREWFRQPSPMYPWMIQRTERYLCRCSDAVVVVSAVQVPYLQSIGVKEERIAVLPNAVDLELFQPDVQTTLAIRQRYGLGGKFVVGFVGSMRPWHDVETLLEGMRLAAQSRKDIFALIIGDGPSRLALERQTEDAELGDRITFVGSIPHEDIPAHIESMDVTVVLSPFAEEFWGSPIKLFEYMAMAKPVIASRSGQLADIVQHRQNGILVEPQNPTQVAEAILELAHNPDLRERLGQAARRAIETKHTWERNAQAVIDLYERYRAK